MPAFHLKTDTAEAVQWMKPGDHPNVHRYTDLLGHVDYRIFSTRRCCIVLVDRGDWIAKFRDGKTDVFSHKEFKEQFAGTEWMPDDVEKMPLRVGIDAPVSVTPRTTQDTIDTFKAAQRDASPRHAALGDASRDVGHWDAGYKAGYTAAGALLKKTHTTSALTEDTPIVELEETLICPTASAPTRLRAAKLILEKGITAGKEAGRAEGKREAAEDRGWPDKDKPGVPLNSDVSGYHLVRSIGRDVVCRFWDAAQQKWKLDAACTGTATAFGFGSVTRYLGVAPELPNAVPPTPDLGWPQKFRPGFPANPNDSGWHGYMLAGGKGIMVRYWDAPRCEWKENPADKHGMRASLVVGARYFGPISQPMPAWGDAPNALTSPGEETVIIDGPIMRRVVKQATDNVLAILKAEKETKQPAPAAEEAEPTPRNVVIIVSAFSHAKEGVAYRNILQVWVQDEEPSGLEPSMAVRALLGGNGRAFTYLAAAMNWVRESNSDINGIFTAVVNGVGKA